MKDNKNELLSDLTHFPRFWFLEFPVWWLSFVKRLMTHIDNQLALTVMIRFWFVPVWQDTTIIGRVLSLLFRTTRVIIGSVVVIAVLLIMFIFLAFWMVVPVLIFIYSIPATVFFFLLWLIDAVSQVLKRENNPIRILLKNSHGDVSEIVKLIRDNENAKHLLKLAEQEDIPQKKIELTFEELINKSQEICTAANEKKLKPEHIFLAVCKHLKFHFDEILATYIWITNKKKWSRVPWVWQEDFSTRPPGGVNRTWTGLITPDLDKVSTDLTKLAAMRKIPELIGRVEEMKDMVQHLGGEGRENVLIVGEAGCGKTRLVEALANEIIRGTEFKSLQFKRLISLNIASLTAGSAGQARERLATVIEEIKSAGNVILFIDEIHNLISVEEGDNAGIVFSGLEPHLDSGEFQFIAATTPVNFKKYIEPNEAFTRTFAKIDLEPSVPEEALKILEWKAFELEQSHNIGFSYKALEVTVELARRYIQDRVLPDSAIDILEDTADKIKDSEKKYITSSDLEQMVTERTKIPVRAADSQKEKKLLLELEKILHQRIVGQDEAISEIASSLRRARTGMAEEGKLIASFLFAGATGVGKTESAKALAEVYFSNEKSMIRIDMSEYQTDESIYRLIGPPPGRKGFELGGQLTETVKKKPFSLILLDEIEKANPRIMDVFLQLLDDARLTDGSGKTIDFSNTIVIATSNVGTKLLVDGAKQGKPFEELQNKVLEELRNKFRPEFLNRFTSIVVYQPLTPDQVKQIARIQIKNLAEKLEKKEIKIKASEELINLLSEKGYSPMWGARELKRVVQTDLEEKIATMILEGKIEPGGTYTLTPELLS